MAKKQGWNLQTNIKDKPNSQGTLFSGGTDQIPDAKRYPRGYTPERQRAVQSEVQVYDHTDTPADADLDPSTNSRRTRAVYEQLKRSSAPVEDMTGLRVNVMHPDHWYARLKGGPLSDATGAYIGNGPYTSPRGEMFLRPEAKGPTVIHELGHHASNLLATPHSKYDTPQKRGEEEGFADSYADKHLPQYKTSYGHPDRFDAADERGRSEYNPRYRQASDKQGNHRPEEFKAGYAHVRPMETRRPNRDDRWRDDDAAWLKAQRHDPVFPGFEGQYPSQWRL